MGKKLSANRLPIIEWIETFYLPVFLDWLAAMGGDDSARQETLRKQLADIRSKFPFSEEISEEKGGVWDWLKSLLKKGEG